MKVNSEQNKRYDVIVIGGGHSGCEAALSSSRNGAKTLLITISMDSIALMPFEGKMGGPVKGQMLEEIGINPREAFIHNNQEIPMEDKEWNALLKRLNFSTQEAE